MNAIPGALRQSIGVESVALGISKAKRPDSGRRLSYLDALRGLAAISVVVAHYTAGLNEEHALHGAETWLVSLSDDPLDIGKTAVVLFFMISGYIIPHSLGATSDRIGRFCISRFFRLYPLYWLALFAGALLPWPMLDHGYTPATLLANVTMLQGYMGKADVVGAAWTLQIELTFYGLCVLLAIRHRMTSPRACAWASIGFLTLALVLALARGLLTMKLPVALPLALALMFFGTLWRQATLIEVPEAKRLAPWLLGIIAVGIVPICMLAYNHDFGFHERWDRYVACYLLAIAIFTLCTTRLPITWRPLVWLGQISYSVYLMHALVASVAHHVGFVADALPVDPLVYLVIMTTLSVLCAWITYTLIEQPFVSIGHRLIQAQRRLPVAMAQVAMAQVAMAQVPMASTDSVNGFGAWARSRYRLRGVS